MNENEDRRLRELNWRRPLRPAETAELHKLLASDPAAAGDWQMDKALTRALDRLPDAPVSSNFTARVIAAAERASRVPSSDRSTRIPWLLRSWLPRLVAGAFMMAVGFFSYRGSHQPEIVAAAETPRPAVAATAMAELPPADWLKNFDTIQRLDKVSVADDELLSALQ